MYQEMFMRAALQKAEEAYDAAEVPVGCVFVFNNEIIGSGRNRTNETKNATRHAEFEAIDEILKIYPPSIFTETDLYVTVEPCIMCTSALRQLGLRMCYFGCRNDRFGGCGSVLDIHNDSSPFRPLPIEYGFFRAEAIILLRKFYLRQNATAPNPKKKANRVLKTDIPFDPELDGKQPSLTTE